MIASYDVAVAAAADSVFSSNNSIISTSSTVQCRWVDISLNRFRLCQLVIQFKIAVNSKWH